MDITRREPTSLREIISGLFTDGTLPFRPDDVDVWEVWEDVAVEVGGETISKSTRPSRLKSGRLRVTVSDPIYLQELRFMESTIRERLNHRLGRTAIEAIDFKVGR